MAEREVVITGSGLISSLGKNQEENWTNIKAGMTGIAPHPADDVPDYLKYYAQSVNFAIPDTIPPKQQGQMKFLNRGALLGFCSAHEAITPVQEGIEGIEPGRRALYVAAGDFTKIGYEFMHPAIKDSTDGNWKNIDEKKLNEAALNKVNPFYLLESLNNNLFSFLSAVIEFMGPNTSLATLSPCGSNALELAYRSIKQNRADIALAVGYGSWINEIALYELEGLGILSQCKAGPSSYRPFDRKRDGFIPGEGGSSIILEAAEAAEKRGAPVLGRIKGFGNCVEFPDNQRLGVPDRVSRKSITMALAEAGCTMSDIGFIVAHGSGTKKGDRSELRSIIDVLGEDGTVPLCGLKPCTGHMGASSDIAEVVLGLFSAREQSVPGTLNFNATEEEFAGLRISSSSQQCQNNTFLSISYGVGGQSSTVIAEAL
jgi:3-oxoacyl-[acyl-carrier-protein] synthase II